ncbi:MAG: haloacid dehalogenase type II [Planctomycetes bacterium]|nr:haloacid dehalogenase type II [Planctomycetota bacterium]
MAGDLTQFRVLTFDCYGTLIDWERGILAVLRRHFSPNGEWADDAMIKAFAIGESEAERDNPIAMYPDILRMAARRVGKALGIDCTPEAADALAMSVGDWPPFDDTVAALQKLNQRYKLVILSNVDRASFAKSNARLGVEFDAIITAEDVAAYKPALSHFRRAAKLFDEWGIQRHEWLHVAQSLFHDHIPAKSMDLKTAWIDRRHGREGWGATLPPNSNVKPDWTFNTLADFAARVEEEWMQ